MYTDKTENMYNDRILLQDRRFINRGVGSAPRLSVSTLPHAQQPVQKSTARLRSQRFDPSFKMASALLRRGATLFQTLQGSSPLAVESLVRSAPIHPSLIMLAKGNG